MMRRVAMVEQVVRCPSLVSTEDGYVLAYERRSTADDSGEIEIVKSYLDEDGGIEHTEVVSRGGSNMNPVLLDADTILYRRSEPDVDEFTAIREGRTGWYETRVRCGDEDSEALFSHEMGPYFVVSPCGRAVHDGHFYVAAVTVDEACPEIDTTRSAGCRRMIQQIGDSYRAVVFRAPVESPTVWERVVELDPGTNETALAFDGDDLVYSARRAKYRGARMFGRGALLSWESDLPCPGVAGSLIHDGEFWWACHPGNSSARRDLCLWRSRDGVDWELVKLVAEGWAGYSAMADAGDSVAIVFEAMLCEELRFVLVPKDSEETYHADLRVRGYDQYPGYDK